MSRNYVDEIVPLYEMTYHGILIYNIFRWSINSLPGKWAYLQNLAFGGMPSFYFYSRFSNKFWDKDGRPVCENPDMLDFSLYDLDKEAAAVRQAEKDFVEQLGDLQLKYFTDYIKFSDNVTCSVYSDGTRVYVNRGDTDANVEQVTVPARSFLRV